MSEDGAAGIQLMGDVNITGFGRSGLLKRVDKGCKSTQVRRGKYSLFQDEGELKT